MQDPIVSPIEPAAATLNPIQPAIDLSGLTITIQGHNATKQADALRAAFPTAIVETGASQPLLRRRTRTEIAIYVFSALALMLVGHLLFSYFTLDRLTLIASTIDVTPDIFYFIMAGFVAQMIDGALGMAYGVTATTFLTERRYQSTLCYGQRSQFRDFHEWGIRLYAPEIRQREQPTL